MDDEYLQELLAVLGPEGLQAMMDAGLMQDRMGLVSSEMQRGQGMAEAPGARGMNVGGTYVASSPLEHAATTMSRIMGQRQMDAAQQKASGLVEGKGKGVEAFIRAMQAGRPEMAPYAGQVPQPIDADPWMGIPYR